jgi:hypothetical protein
MSTNAIAIIQDALEQIGAYAPGETIQAQDYNRSFTVLNDMIGQWSNDHLACFAFLTQSILLVNNQSDYTIGPSVTADVNGPRPIQIQQVYLTDSNGNKYNVAIRTLEDFNLIRNQQITSQIPTDCYYDPQMPIATLMFWPVPVIPLYTANWTSYLQLESFPGLVGLLDFPPGYEAAIKSNLAVKLCKYFGLAVPKDVKDEANETRGTIKRSNHISQVSYYDPAIVITPASGWNILSGTYNGRRY